MIRKEGIGSYFHFEDLQVLKHNTIQINFEYQIFYTGRHALLFILDKITSENKISKIWFPNYYCQHTLDWIKKSYPNISIYEINPFEFTSDKINLNEFATPNDVVLINNYWGLSTMGAKKNVNSPIIIEDHSHGWLSEACLNSQADYCFVSLRKSLPIPLGGIYWKPGSIVSNTANIFKKDAGFYKIWEDMLYAMQLKSEFIHSGNSMDSSKYLPLFYKVEEALNKYTKFAYLKEQHEAIINSFINVDTRWFKKKNLDFLYSKIHDTVYFKIIKRPNYTAFGYHLLFKDVHEFDSLKQFLVSNSIYASSLWPDNNLENQWRYFLNIHVDYRYTLIDMEHIVFVINNWLKNK